MATEAILGQLRGTDLIKTLVSDRTPDFSPQFVYREWGRIGLNGPYSVIVNKDAMKGFLQKRVKLRPHQIHRTQIHILGEKPHKINPEFAGFIYPAEERKRRRPLYAFIEEHKPTRTHFVTISGFALWQDLRHDRDLVLEHQKRKRKTDASWAALGKKTKQVDITEEVRGALEQATDPEALRRYMAELLSMVGTICILKDLLHETDHSYRYRTAYEFWLNSDEWIRKVQRDLEATAEAAEQTIGELGEWRNMVYFSVRPDAISRRGIKESEIKPAEPYRRQPKRSGVFRLSREEVLGKEESESVGNHQVGDVAGKSSSVNSATETLEKSETVVFP